ncbi:hypothetical protein, partial [Nitrosococcus oceani]|uniref:hypothetical protein n=1 Tax=Nitrosococcus oceani TaxID=1229 RepID=UPI001E2CEA0B
LSKYDNLIPNLRMKNITTRRENMRIMGAREPNSGTMLVPIVMPTVSMGPVQVDESVPGRPEPCSCIIKFTGLGLSKARVT